MISLHRNFSNRTNNIISIIIAFVIALNLTITISYLAKNWEYALTSLVSVSNFLIFLGSFIILAYFTKFLIKKLK